MREAHNLKGVASNMGARELASAAETLELACREGVPDAAISTKLRELTEVLSPVIEAIMGAGLRAAPAAPPEQAVVAVDIEASLGRLRELLECSDTRAREVPRRAGSWRADREHHRRRSSTRERERERYVNVNGVHVHVSRSR